MSLNRYLKSHTLQFHSVYQSDTAFLIIRGQRYNISSIKMFFLYEKTFIQASEAILRYIRNKRTPKAIAIERGSACSMPLATVVVNVSRKVSHTNCRPSIRTNSTAASVNPPAVHRRARRLFRLGRRCITRLLNPLSATSCRFSAKKFSSSLSLFSVITILF